MLLKNKKIKSILCISTVVMSGLFALDGFSGVPKGKGLAALGKKGIPAVKITVPRIPAVNNLTGKVVTRAVQNINRVEVHLPKTLLYHAQEKAAAVLDDNHWTITVGKDSSFLPPQTRFLRPLLGSVFQASGSEDSPILFSGTVFKTVYNRKEVVFGAVAAHSIANKKYPQFGLRQIFQASVYSEGGQVITVPAEIVHMGTAEMIDVALVKFRPEDEKYFTPLPLNSKEIQVGDPIQTLGFSATKILYYPQRKVSAIGVLTFRAPIGGDFRIGLCGGAVLNPQNELVGIHVGAEALFTECDLGHAIHAEFLNRMVAAYYNDGQGTFPLEINGQKIVDVPLDGYISQINLLTAKRNTLTKMQFIPKFSYTRLEEALERWDPRYVEIQINKNQWLDIEEGVVQHDVGPYVIYTYDWWEKKMVNTTLLPSRK